MASFQGRITVSSRSSGMVAGGAGTEVFAKVQEHSFGHDARRDEPVADAGDAPGPVAGFLGQFAAGGLVGRSRPRRWCRPGTSSNVSPTA